MTDEDLLELVEQDTQYNDGIGCYVTVHVINNKLVVRVEDANTTEVTVAKWQLGQRIV